MRSDRHNLNAILSPTAYAGWQRFCAVHGMTMSALAEALGAEFTEMADPDARLTPVMRKVVQAARRITAERKARAPGSDLP